MTTALDHGTHHVVLNGARLLYHVYGRGPVVVALPGGPGFSWHYLRSPLLEQHATVVYFEPVGTGDSARLDPPSQYGRARDVSDLEELRKHLGLSRLALLGHSAGGFVAQEYALTYPDNIEALVLYDTSPTNGPEFSASLKAEMNARSDRAWFPEAAAALDAIFSRVLPTEEEALKVGRPAWPLYFFDYDADPGPARRLFEAFRVDPVRFQKAPPVEFDFRPRLKTLHVPALVIVGARDFICAPVLAKEIVASLPGSRLVVMERSGHFAHVEEPEAFATAVGSFLRERSLRGGA